MVPGSSKNYPGPRRLCHETSFVEKNPRGERHSSCLHLQACLHPGLPCILLWLSQSFLVWIITLLTFPLSLTVQSSDDRSCMVQMQKMIFSFRKQGWNFPKQIVIRETEQKQIIKGHRSHYAFCFVIFFSLFSFSFKLLIQVTFFLFRNKHL